MEFHSEWNITQIGTSPKLERQSNWNFTQIGMSLKLEWHSNQNVPQIEMSLKLECHSNWYVTQIEISLKLNCHSNWNVTQIEMSPKFECYSNWKTKLIEKVVNPKTSKSASIGPISILLDYIFSFFFCLLLSAPYFVCSVNSFFHSSMKYTQCHENYDVKAYYLFI